MNTRPDSSYVPDPALIEAPSVVELTAAQRVAAFMAAHGLSIEAEFVPLSRSRNAPGKGGDYGKYSLNWRVTLWRDKPTEAQPVRTPNTRPPWRTWSP